LKLAENILQDEVRQNPENTSAMSHLALTLTRLGKYPEALLFADRATQKDSTDAELKYRVAQVYSMQMYSRKTSSTDEDLKQRCITTLREAVAISFRIDLLLNVDFYNMYEHANFQEIIRQPM
jgi:predicted Zn-dependent protease